MKRTFESWASFLALFFSRSAVAFSLSTEADQCNAVLPAKIETRC